MRIVPMLCSAAAAISSSITLVDSDNQLVVKANASPCNSYASVEILLRSSHSEW